MNQSHYLVLYNTGGCFTAGMSICHLFLFVALLYLIMNPKCTHTKGACWTRGWVFSHQTHLHFSGFITTQIHPSLRTVQTDNSTSFPNARAHWLREKKTQNFVHRHLWPQQRGKHMHLLQVGKKWSIGLSEHSRYLFMYLFVCFPSTSSQKKITPGKSLLALTLHVDPHCTTQPPPSHVKPVFVFEHRCS